MAVTNEELITEICSQVRSSAVWVNHWRRYSDIASVRNLSFALGRVSGLVILARSKNIELPPLLEQEILQLEKLHEVI